MIDFNTVKSEDLTIELQLATEEQKKNFRKYASGRNDNQITYYIAQATKQGLLLTPDMVAITAKDFWGKHNGQHKQAQREAFNEARELGILKKGIEQRQVTGSFKTRLDDIAAGTSRSNKDVLIANGVAEEDTSRLLAKPCKSKINTALSANDHHTVLRLIQCNIQIGKRQMQSVSDNKLGAALSNIEGMATVVNELERLHVVDVDQQTQLDAQAIEMAEMRAEMECMKAQLNATTILAASTATAVSKAPKRNEKKELAFQLKAGGMGIVAIAEKVGVSRKTVSRWFA